MEKIKNIEKLITSKLPGAIVKINDTTGNENHLHLDLLVVSDAFKGKMLLEQHKMVMGILKESLKEDVHAVQIKTMTPEQYQIKR